MTAAAQHRQVGGSRGISPAWASSHFAFAPRSHTIYFISYCLLGYGRTRDAILSVEFRRDGALATCRLGESIDVKGRKQLSDEAATYVRELIVSGQLHAPEFVRVDRIAAELGISVTPVREGLLALRGEGFLDLEPRRGFVVSSLTREDIRDLFWVQAQLAGELAARAAGLMTDADVKQLEEHQTELSKALRRGDFPEVERRNYEFHSLINRAADAPKLAWFLRVATRYVPARFYHKISGWADASARDHLEVIEALRNHDAQAARKAMSEHIVHAGQLLALHRDRSIPDGTSVAPAT
jgi:DNA-binding GntR family transcriptional regulator